VSLPHSTRRSANSGQREPERLSAALITHFKLHPFVVIRNLLSFRLMFGALVLGVIAGAVAGIASNALVGPVAIVVAVIVWVFAAVNPQTVLYCPFCRKRVKAGASACHHCGRTVRGSKNGQTAPDRSRARSAVGS
jgi:hypothetical protein